MNAKTAETSRFERLPPRRLLAKGRNGAEYRWFLAGDCAATLIHRSAERTTTLVNDD